MRNEDIADPYIVVRNIKDPGRLAYEVTLPYFKRSLEIDVSGKLGEKKLKNDTEYQICLLARDSKTFVRALQKEQCRELPRSSGHSVRASHVIFVTYILIQMLF